MSQRAFSFTLKDVLITLLLIGVICVIALKFSMPGKLAMPEKELTVVLRIEEQLPSFHKAIKPGDKVFQKGSLEPFGTVVKVEAKPAQHYVPDANGNYYLREFNDQEDVYLTIKSSGFLSLSGSPIIDNTFFHANLYLPAHTDQAVFASRVISVE
jgi:hypothetical protein